MRAIAYLVGTLVLWLVVTPIARSQPDHARELKRQVAADVEAMKKRSQVMNDMVFSFAELGFQEFETSKYLTGYSREGRLHRRARHRGHPDGLDGDVGIGQAGDRPRLRH